MGRGDKKTAKGKRFAGSHGNARAQTVKKTTAGKAAPAVKSPVAKTAAKKAPAKKAAAKKRPAKKAAAKKSPAKRSAAKKTAS